MRSHIARSLIPRAFVEAVRRATGAGVKHDWSIFCDRQVESLTLASLLGERPDGGWRAYAGTVIERKWSDIFTIDVFLASQRPKVIVELGTGSGAFSCYLATYAYLNGARFFTFDLQRKTAPTKRANYRALRLVRKLGGRVYRRDIFHPKTRTIIQKLVNRGPSVFLYCDNGNKAREVQLFAGDLKASDFIGVHDYGFEVHQHDLAGLVGTSLRPWNPKFFEDLSSSNRIFQRIIV
ncbi:MAG: hypothetical protein NT151_09600 [Acidobacteria bacterium]|nr:hypothetical protein [Acidobacteriota bacterium]